MSKQGTGAYDEVRSVRGYVLRRKPKKKFMHCSAAHRDGCDLIAAAGVRVDLADRDCANCNCAVGFPKLLKKKEGMPMKIYCVKPPRFIRGIIKLFMK